MPLIKMGAAARRSGSGSTNTIRRALSDAGIPLTTLSPGVYAVEEEDLNRFLQSRTAEAADGSAPIPKPKKKSVPRDPKIGRRR